MEITTAEIEVVFNKFNHSGQFISSEELTSGHINDTFLIKTSKDSYVLQRINGFVFKNAKDLILNKSLVSKFIQSKLINLSYSELKKRVLIFVNTKKNKPFVKDAMGNFWNLTLFINESKTFERVENEKIAFEGGKLIGDFLNLTNGLSANSLVEILPNFHAMSFRYKQFNEALQQANESRLKLAKTEIALVKKLKKEMHLLENFKNEGKIPLRVTHNDTKISNILFNNNNEGLCVIDTDTVMEGIIHYDFGDAVRTFCNTANEDETNLEKVNFQMSYFKEFVKGFLSKTYKELSFFDVQNLALGVKTITFIMGLRMLTDFLNNDVYYKTKYDLHNLDRAKNQFKLVQEITEKFNEMNSVILNTFNLYCKL